MVINTSTVLAMRCPKCGRLNFHAISLFAFSGSHSVVINCECGTSVMMCSIANNKKFSLQTDCGMCETNHIYYYSLKELFSSNVLPLECLETGLEIGFLGPKSKVKEALVNQERTFVDIVEDVGFKDFFDNPEVMYQVLEYLNCISEEGSLTCRCGNTNIDLEILPDRLELGCSDCGSKGIIFAETNGDLLVLKQFGRIELSDQGFVLRGIEKQKKRKNNQKNKKGSGT